MKKRVWIIGGIVAAIIGTGAVASRYMGHSMEDRTHFATYMITKKLDLNDSQEASLDTLAASWLENATSMKAFRKTMFEELKTLAGGEDITVDQVNGLREKIKTQLDATADKLTPEFVTFYNSLNADQREIVAARLAEGPHSKGGHHGGRHGKRWGDGHDGKGHDGKGHGEGYGKKHGNGEGMGHGMGKGMKKSSE